MFRQSIARTTGLLRARSQIFNRRFQPSNRCQIWDGIELGLGRGVGGLELGFVVLCRLGSPVGDFLKELSLSGSGADVLGGGRGGRG